MIPETITPEILNSIYFSQTMPTVILSTLTLLITFLLIGLLIVRKSRSKFMSIWGISVLFSAIGITFLYLFPNFIQMILDTFKFLSNA